MKLLVGSLLCLVLAACGVSTEDQPQPITDTVSSDNGPTPSVDSSPDSATPTSTTTTTTTMTPPTRPVSPPHSTEPRTTR